MFINYFQKNSYIQFLTPSINASIHFEAVETSATADSISSRLIASYDKGAYVKKDYPDYSESLNDGGLLIRIKYGEK